MKGRGRIARKIAVRGVPFFLALALSLLCVSRRTKIFTPHLTGHLASAAYHNRLGLMKFLLFVGADADAKCQADFFYGNLYSSAGWRPIHAASISGSNDAVALLLEHGARIDAGAEPGSESPLAAAARAGHASTVRFLLARGAKVSAGVEIDGGCEPALMGAATEGHTDVVGVLLGNGAGEKNCIDAATFEAVHFGRTQTVRFLISKGADVNWVNKNYSYGLNSLDVALNREDGEDLVEILSQAGAKQTDVGRYFRSISEK